MKYIVRCIDDKQYGIFPADDDGNETDPVYLTCQSSHQAHNIADKLTHAYNNGRCDMRNEITKRLKRQVERWVMFK